MDEQVEAVHPDYVIALMEYRDGRLPWPPCLTCCTPIPNAPFTGATQCADCVEDTAA